MNGWGVHSMVLAQNEHGEREGCIFASGGDKMVYSMTGQAL